MEFISVSNYVLIHIETIPKNSFAIFMFFIACLMLILNKYNRLASSTLFFIVLMILSIVFPLNGPDKASYQELFEHLHSFSDIFKYANTADSPSYYALSILLNNLGINTYYFFIIQNILISLSLLYITLRLRNGIYISLSLFFTHLLVPFSTRIHLLLLLCIFIVFVKRKITRYFLSTFLIGIHPLGSVLPLLIFNSDDVSFRLKIKNLFIFGVIFIFILWGHEFIYSKFYQYIYNSTQYTDNESSIGISFLINLYLSIITYVTLRYKINGLERILLFSPPTLSFLTIISPMFNRFLFPSDLLYALLFVKYEKTPRLFFLLVLVILSFLRFYKNLLSNEYYIL